VPRCARVSGCTSSTCPSMYTTCSRPRPHPTASVSRPAGGDASMIRVYAAASAHGKWEAITSGAHGTIETHIGVARAETRTSRSNQIEVNGCSQDPGTQQGDQFSSRAEMFSDKAAAPFSVPEAPQGRGMRQAWRHAGLHTRGEGAHPHELLENVVLLGRRPVRSGNLAPQRVHPVDQRRTVGGKAPPRAAAHTPRFVVRFDFLPVAQEQRLQGAPLKKVLSLRRAKIRS